MNIDLEGADVAATPSVDKKPLSCVEAINKVMRSMTYLPRRARVPHPPNKFRHHLKIGYESCEAW